MPTDLNEHPAKPEQRDENFGEGQGDPARFPEDEAVGRFDEGQEELPEDDPEKHEEGRFDEGQTDTPHGYTP
jgi:hypothetical protein